MPYDYDRTAASRVTFGRFGRLDAAGGGGSDILLDGVVVGTIDREVDMDSVGVQQKVYTVRAYVPSISGPIGYAPEAEAKFEDKEFESLPELKRALTAFLSKLPEGVSEAYRLYKLKKITSAEWVAQVRALL